MVVVLLRGLDKAYKYNRIFLNLFGYFREPIGLFLEYCLIPFFNQYFLLLYMSK